MATDTSKDQNPNPNPEEDEEPEENANGNGTIDPEDAEYDDEELEDEEDDDNEPETALSQREKLKSLFRRLSSEPVRIRVHDVIIKGNERTKESVIEDEVMDVFRSATTVQELLRAASIANVRLEKLEVFNSVSITLDAGPPELPGTANVVIEVREPKNPLTGDIGIFSKPEVRDLGFACLIDQL